MCLADISSGQSNMESVRSHAYARLTLNDLEVQWRIIVKCQEMETQGIIWEKQELKDQVGTEKGSWKVK